MAIPSVSALKLTLLCLTLLQLCPMMLELWGFQVPYVRWGGASIMLIHYAKCGGAEAETRGWGALSHICTRTMYDSKFNYCQLITNHFVSFPS